MTIRRHGVALQQTTIGDYRQAVLDLLVARWGDDFHIYTGAEYFDPSTRTSVSVPPSNLTLVRNRFMLGRRLEWQHGVVAPLVSARVAIVEFNPRILSVWVILVARRVLRRRSVLWGHAWSRRGAGAKTDHIRQAMRVLAGIVLVYTERDRIELAERMPGMRIFVAPNSVVRRDAMGVRQFDGQPRDLIYSGRLVAAKKPALAVRAFIDAVRAGLDPDVRLLIAGDGPERELIDTLVKEAGVADRVVLLGHVPPAEIGDHYARALAAVSPGYVGLSLIQSLGYGVPMIFARDEPHAPEIAAAKEGFNALVVDSDSVSAFRDAILELVRDRDAWLVRRHQIADRCADTYSVEVMADGIEAAATL